ncbi:glycosyltransferase, partial [candidate division WOR-3 bacterium]|nr:glycosyltransferase [candidate division WOR-3 bacterium]
FENCIAHSSVLYRKALVLKIGGYNESFRKSQDYELWIRLSKIAKILKIKEALVVRKEHIINASFNTKKQHKENEELLFFKNIRDVLHNSKFDSNKLLSLKYGKTNGLDVLDLLRILNKINKSIIKTAPPFLRTDELDKSGYKKRNKILKTGVRFFLNAIRSPMRILKFVSNHLLHILRYILEYSVFLFSFNLKLSQLKINNGKKNILCIVPYMVVGGAEKVILNIAKGTDREKFSFHIVTTEPANNVWYNKFHPYFQNIIISTKRVASEKICNKYFRQLIKRLNIDMVLISNSLIGYKYLPQLKSEFKYVRTMDLLHAGESTGAVDGLEWVTPYLDRRICISNHLKEYIVKKYKSSGVGNSYIKRLRVIYNGIDTRQYSLDAQMKGKFKSQFGIPDDVKIISFNGRFSSEKNPLLFVDTARRVIEKSPNYKLKFVMAGDGPEFDEVRNTIDKYGIKDYFILTGMIDNIAEFLADTYVLLMVSKSEGFPIAILEAMAMKVPIISTNVGAVHEIIKDSVNGYLINPGDNVVEQFACKILDLLSGNLNHSELAEKERETVVSKYSLETMGVKYQDVFDGH